LTIRRAYKRYTIAASKRKHFISNIILFYHFLERNSSSRYHVCLYGVHTFRFRPFGASARNLASRGIICAC